MKDSRSSRWKHRFVWLTAIAIALIAGLGYYALSDEELKQVDHLAPRRALAPATASTGWGQLADVVKTLPVLSPEDRRRIEAHRSFFASPPPELPPVPQLSAEQLQELEAILDRPGFPDEQVQPPLSAELLPLLPWLRGSISDAIVRRDTAAFLRILRTGRALMRKHHIRHLIVLDANQSLVGMLALRYLLYDLMDDMERSVGDLIGYIMKDGPGG